ncbi:MAG: GNAT family N-acetyltransferase [Defluviitaleaceae bacterium]|nr:GNAT family N-acetyltransferase [Defluviitaleaceae bacterium]
MNDIYIKDFTPKDEEAFYNMASLFHGSDAVVYGKINHEALKTTFNACINGSPFVSGFFICYNGEVCGYALMCFTYSNEYGGKIMIIDEIYVKEGFRGKGLASYFVKEIIDKYKNDVVYVEVEVKKDNVEAINLYKKFEFGFNDYQLMYKFFNR